MTGRFGPLDGPLGASGLGRAMLPASAQERAREAARAAIPGLDHLVPTAARKPREPVLCGDLAMRIGRDGTWYYQDSPIGRKELVCLFASVLRREPDGSYWLVTPAEKGRIIVEDVPFIAVELFCSGSCDATLGGHGQVLSFRTNVDQVVSAGEHHPIRVARDAAANPTPYIMVRDGLEARISRAVYYELVALAVPEVVGGARVIGVWSRNVFFPLGDPEACQAP
jgi:hypothetical protein